MNDANIDFYRRIGANKLRELAAIQGLTQTPEIPLLMPLIKDARLLIEIGAGYGRIIKGLKNNGFRGKIVAQERCPELCAVLRSDCADEAEVFQADIKRQLYPEQPDALLWMWSGILEFTPEEQQTVIRRLFAHLKCDGILVIEIPREIRHVGKPIDERRIIVDTEWGRLDAYLPSEEELLDYTEKAGFTPLQTIHYQTESGLKRSMYVFKKNQPT